MEKIHNFRDFGGYKTENGNRLKKGILFRSGGLSKANNDDLKELSSLKIKTICDLRSEGERKKEPDRIPNNEPVTFFNIPMRPIVDYHGRSLKRLFSLMFGEERRRDYIGESYTAYREYATGYLPQLKALFVRISNPDNLPLLIHCSAGKDRTGVVASMIQQIVGVHSALVMNDYLETNQNLGEYTTEIADRLKKLAYFGVPWKMYMPLFEARTDYLNAAFSQIKDEFGAFDQWVRRGLDFSKKEIDTLAKSLLT